MTPAPLVSVCVPTRDRGPLLAEALTSALAQEGPALEVVVCDDGSRDDPGPLVRVLGDPRVRLVRNPAPLGVARSRDRCLAEARGRYVAWLDSDDTYLPGALARQVAVLEAQPGVAMVHGGFHVVDAGGARGRPWPAPFAADAVETGPAALAQLLASNEVSTSTVVARGAAHDRAGGSGARPGASSSDWAMWLRLALRGGVAYTAAPVARYRQHPATISHATLADGRRLRCDVSVVRRLLAEERGALGSADALGALAHAALAAKALLHAGEATTRGSRAEALRAVVLAARLAPGPVGPLAPRLLRATAREDLLECHATTQALLARLAERLEGTRFGTRVAALATRDHGWDAVLERTGAVVDRIVPADACVGAVAKWDPSLLARSRRAGRNFPDRGTLPGGYPADSDAAIAHLEEQRRSGLSHLVLPAPSFWWLEHYRGLADHLEARHRRVWRDADCVVFDLRAAAA